MYIFFKHTWKEGEFQEWHQRKQWYLIQMSFGWILVIIMVFCCCCCGCCWWWYCRRRRAVQGGAPSHRGLTRFQTPLLQILGWSLSLFFFSFFLSFKGMEWFGGRGGGKWLYFYRQGLKANGFLFFKKKKKEEKEEKIIIIINLEVLGLNWGQRQRKLSVAKAATLRQSVCEERGQEWDIRGVCPRGNGGSEKWRVEICSVRWVGRNLERRIVGHPHVKRVHMEGGEWPPDCHVGHQPLSYWPTN